MNHDSGFKAISGRRYIGGKEDTKADTNKVSREVTTRGLASLQAAEGQAPNNIQTGARTRPERLGAKRPNHIRSNDDLLKLPPVITRWSNPDNLFLYGKKAAIKLRRCVSAIVDAPNIPQRSQVAAG